MKLNEEYTIVIESVSSDGNGIGRIDGITVFVPFTVPGDKVVVRIVRAHRRYAEAETVRMISPGISRKAPECRHYYDCGGCALMHMEYEAQLREKRGMIEGAMRRIGGFADFKLDDMFGMEEPFRYRNKMVFHAGMKDGAPVFGFYAPKSHNVIPVTDCLAGSDANGEIIRCVTEYMKETRLKPYDERSGSGSVRMLFTREAHISGEIMVVLCVRGVRLPQQELLVQKLTEAVPKIGSIVLNVNKAKLSHTLGAQNIALYGRDYIEDEIMGVKFRISPQSFFQVNPVMTERIYTEAVNALDEIGAKRVLDIYCGIGTISLIAAKKAAHVTGVEIVEKAAADARVNAESNGITNAEFYADSAESVVPKLIEAGERPDLIVLDPPRKGSDKATLEAILKARPERIVYVSCDPATLARDTKLLCGGGYKITRAVGADMFCGTVHVETVVLMSRVEKYKNFDSAL